jgi:prepilin-type N-terminal cleavage/methylation domain-containing protein
MFLNSFIKSIKSNNSSFTLIELLIVIAILAILSLVVVVVINPLELLKQARDSQRLSDLQTINKAIGILIVDQVGVSLGDTSTIYTSLIDPNTTTCASLNLPPLPSPFKYRCSTSTLNATRIDGTGWIPLNFSLISFKSPISKLPLDPINQTSTGEYYTYFPGGSYELTAMLTALKNKGKDNIGGKDGGDNNYLYELGSNLFATPSIVQSRVEGNSLTQGLVGYWTFDEGQGNIAYDYSGNNNNGTLINGPVWKSGVDCKVGKCLKFYQSRVNLINGYSFVPGGNSYTILFWTKLLSFTPAAHVFVGPYPPLQIHFYNPAYTDPYVYRFFYVGDDGGNYFAGGYNAQQFTESNIWHFVVLILDRQILKARFYVDGNLY